MARVCQICGKGSLNGNKISHAHNVSKRTWRPNLHVMRAVIDGQTKRVKVCTRCLRSGNVVKASR